MFLEVLCTDSLEVGWNLIEIGIWFRFPSRTVLHLLFAMTTSFCSFFPICRPDPGRADSLGRNFGRADSRTRGQWGRRYSMMIDEDDDATNDELGEFCDGEVDESCGHSAISGTTDKHSGISRKSFDLKNDSGQDNKASHPFPISGYRTADCGWPSAWPGMAPNWACRRSSPLRVADPLVAQPLNSRAAWHPLRSEVVHLRGAPKELAWGCSTTGTTGERRSAGSHDRRCL